MIKNTIDLVAPEATEVAVVVVNEKEAVVAPSPRTTMTMKMIMEMKKRILMVKIMMMMTTTTKKHLHPNVLVGIAQELFPQIMTEVVRENHKIKFQIEKLLDRNHQTHHVEEMAKGRRLGLRLERGRSYWRDKKEGMKIVILFSNQKEPMQTHTFQTITPLVLEILMDREPSGNQLNTSRLKLLG